MTLKSFVMKYYGQKVDYDRQFGAQCVDLARQYFKDVWQLPAQPEGVVGAKDFFLLHEQRSVQNKMMDKITASNGNVPPPEGAVLIFGDSNTNPYGHIAICILADEESAIVLEQDGFAQSGTKFARWDYKRLLGWLVKKG